MDTPGRPQTPAQLAADKRLRAARIAHNNVLANKENFPVGSSVWAAQLSAAATELAAAQAQYNTQFGI